MVSRKTRTRALALCSAAIVMFCTGPAVAATFSVTYADAAGEGFHDPALGSARQAAFQRAISTWQGWLTDTTTIHVRAEFEPMGGSTYSATLGTGGASYVLNNFRNAPVRNTYYASALGEAIAQRNYTGPNADLVVTFNSDIDGAVLGGRDWHYDESMPVGGDVDFQTVAMHELAHGLGVFSSFRANGSWGYSSRPVIFDTFLVNAAGERLVDLTEDAANVTAEVFFDGPAARAAYQAAGGSGPVPVYAPATWRSGSSISHLDEATFRGEDDLMTPYLSVPQRDISPVLIGVMDDLGWAVTPEPASLTLLATGGALMMIRRRRR